MTTPWLRSILGKLKLSRSKTALPPIAIASLPIPSPAPQPILGPVPRKPAIVREAAAQPARGDS